MDLKELCNQANEIVLEVGQFIRDHSDKITASDIEEKDLNSLVSYVDKQAEEKLVATLSKLVPGCGFITEEDTEDVEGEI